MNTETQTDKQAETQADGLNPGALYWASFNRFELRLPGAAVLEIARSGQNEDAVAEWVDRCEFSASADAEAIREELAEYGAWDEHELSDDAENRARIVWLAAWQVAEENSPDCERSVSEAATDAKCPPLNKVGSRYGAPMGRSNVMPDGFDTGNASPALHLQRLEWVDGDYDAGGAYWGGGSGDFIFRAVTEDGEIELFTRAYCRAEAEKKIEGMIPNAEVLP